MAITLISHYPHWGECQGISVPGRIAGDVFPEKTKGRAVSGSASAI
jgi:hypothetical protein